MKIKLSLCGDVLISRRLPEGFISGGGIFSTLHENEFRFANLETTIHRREGYPAAFPGGGYAMADPLCVQDLIRLGFNIFSTANNHAMDYSCNGLIATNKYLTEYGVPYAGTGINLSDASKPAFFEGNNASVALVAVTSSFHDSYSAGPQNQDMMGRPGVAPLRHKAVYELNHRNLKTLCRIAKESGVNAYHDMGIKSGYLTPIENVRFGSFFFQEGENGVCHTTPHPDDLQRTVNIVKDARYSSDLVIVSIHSHQLLGSDSTRSPEFISIFSKECINAGADIVVCHGPHRLRGIELYNQGIIFHGLGNFIFQHELVEFLPEELYNRYGLKRQDATGVNELFRMRSCNGTKGVKTKPVCYHTIICCLECNEREMITTLVPVEIDVNTGLPSLSENISILEDVVCLSEEFGTPISINKEEIKATIHVKR